jgi:hypothetical protein
MNSQLRARLAIRIEEAALWCSQFDLISSHNETPEEARRKELFADASRLMERAYSKRIIHVFDDKKALEKRALELYRTADIDSLAPLEAQLRTLALQPSDAIGSAMSEETTQEIVATVISIRERLTKAISRTAADPTRGRILQYVPCENVSDGASRFASHGFFDVYDCPPWDLWLLYSERTLYSWIPEVLYPLAQSGIDANAIDCIRWVD